MPRLTRRTLAVAIAVSAIAGSLATFGCSKPAPVLTQAQLQAGVIGKKHPVTQDAATKAGCSCHTEAAKKAGTL